MQLDFWQLSRDPVERVVALIAERTRGAGEKLLVVANDDAQRAAMSAALWEAKPGAFLANGETSPARQPILLSGECVPANGARYAVLADGIWRDGADAFERVFLLFGDAGLTAARALWRQFDGREDIDRSYFAQEDGKWVKKA
jgi:DNA polymerase-3 subunit chi